MFTSQAARHPSRLLTISLTVALTGTSASARAQDLAEVEDLRATTQALIDTLVETGLLTKEKADVLLKKAKAKAQLNKSQIAEAAQMSNDGKRVIRVPFVPESVKAQIREEIKTEVLAQAKTERWGQVSAYPEWLNRFTFEGDFRVRAEQVGLGADNSTPGIGNFLNGDYSRAADIAFNTGSNKAGIYNYNTQEDFERSRVRARVGVVAKITDDASATFRVSTGNTNDRTSTNQSMGQSFNKYSVVFDQAYAKLALAPGYSMFGGRMPNPFFSSDLVWAEDLGFEGFASTATRQLGGATQGFAALGYFPISIDNPGTTRSRSLLAAQAGVDMNVGSGDKFKMSVALYNFNGLDGVKETTATQTSAPDYATRYEYGSGFRQRGNTLFRVTAPGDSSTNVFGLASDFRVLNVTTAVDLNHVLPLPFRLTGDVVKNIGFDRNKILARTGQVLADGKDYGFLVRAHFGPQRTDKKGKWNVNMTYRYLGSDATLDAFTNSDFGMGGTNSKGWVLGGSYSFMDNTSLSARWLTTNQIDPFAPGGNTKLSVDTIQVDWNARF